MKRLNARKATQITDIPVKISKENADIFSAYICDFLNETKFPAILKNGDIRAAFKNSLTGSKKNCQPVSISPIFSKNICENN